MIIFDLKKIIHDKNFFFSFTNIYDHFQARSAKTFMNIYGSLMIIFDQKKSFMTRKIFVSLMTIFDQKNIHTQRAKFDFIAYRNQACEFGINPHSHA